MFAWISHPAWSSLVYFLVVGIFFLTALLSFYGSFWYMRNGGKAPLRQVKVRCKRTIVAMLCYGVLLFWVYSQWKADFIDLKTDSWYGIMALAMLFICIWMYNKGSKKERYRTYVPEASIIDEL